MKRIVRRRAKIDWSRFDAMTNEQRHAAAMADPDARPMRPEDLARMPRVPQVKIIRRALKLSQDDFAAYFRIPIAMLRDWELVLLRHKPLRPYVSCAWSAAAWAAWQASDDSGDEPSAHGRD